MIRAIRNIGLVILGILLMSACDSMTSTHEKYIGDEEITYPGKADSVKVYPGKNRIKLSWVSFSDPMVTHAKVYWNSLEDSLEIDIPESQDTDTIEVMINDLEEGSYNFEIRTFDENGNVSVPVRVLGEVYGDKYISGLLSRPVISTKWQPASNGGSDTTWVEWGSSDATSVGTVVRYTNSTGTSKELVVPSEESIAKIEDYKLGEGLEYQTMFKPDSMAIDTFYAETETANVNEIQLVNSGPDFDHGKWDGSRWGNLKDWTANEAARTRTAQDGSLVGGFDNYNGPGHLALERWSSGDTAITNGKIYKNITLPAGTYTFSAYFNDDDPGKSLSLGASPQAEVYLAVAEGNTMPDIANLESSTLGHKFLETPATEVEFTLSKESDITLGLVGTMEGTQQNVRISEVALEVIELQ